MEKYRAIPKGYMTVGQLAGKMNTTVRTLQYYDKEGLLTPSAVSEGGRRLYTDRDVIRLHQIMSLKSLGFSLEDIKKRLFSLDTPSDVADALTEQAEVLKQQITKLSETLNEIEMLREEVLQMQTVDFKKYADIIVNLQIKNENYRLIKYFDDRMMEHARKHTDKEWAVEIIEGIGRINRKAIQLMKQGVSPQSEEGQELAAEFWNILMEFTNGDMSLLPSLMEAGTHEKTSNEQENGNDFIGPAIDTYIAKLGINPFEGGN